MRIIAGALGGRRLRAPSGAATRPTADRVREALFSILGPPPEGARALDLFAGAGGLGLEAISRGVRQVVFVDAAPAALRVLRANIRDLGVEAQCRVLALDARRALPRLAAEGERFTWIFIDPPYQSDLAAACLELLADGSMFTGDSMAIVEHDRRNAPLDTYGSLIRTDVRRYGDTVLSFYRRSEQ